MEKKSKEMCYLENKPGRACFIGQKEYLFFSGYSYLGMNHVKKFNDLLKKGIDKYGVIFPSSRISNTRLALYEEFESTLSALTGMEKTVSFSSGYLAGKTITEILSSCKNIFTAPSVHPAIDNKPAQTPEAKTFEDWQQNITALINASGEKEFVLVSDSINIMKGTVNDFSFLQNIKADKKIVFLVDDSHGIGITGIKGEGIISKLLKQNNIEYIITYSLSKAFSIGGGAVSCSKKFGELLLRHPGYAGSTAISPASVYAFLGSQNSYSEQRAKLFENIKYLKENLPPFLKGNKSGLPIFICRNENAAEQFYENNIIISSFGYPYPSSKKINRVVLNSLHTKDDIDKLCKTAI